MFRIYSGTISTEELVVLKELWSGMEREFGKMVANKCDNNCDDCDYKHLCINLFKTGVHIDELIEKRAIPDAMARTDDGEEKCLGGCKTCKFKSKCLRE